MFQSLHTKQALFWAALFPKQKVRTITISYDDNQTVPLPKDLAHNVPSWKLLEETTFSETMFTFFLREK